MSYLKNFHYQISGNERGPKLVFVHGLMGYAANWRKIIAAFEPQFHILAYDQRGHGQSFQPKEGYAPEDYANDLKIILDELGWDKIYLVGHSMGGRNTLCFTFRYPQRVNKFVIEDIGPEADPNAVNNYLSLLDLVPTPFLNRKVAKEFFLNEFVKLAKGYSRPESLGQFLYSNIIQKEDGTVNWRFNRQGILESVRLGRAQNRWDELTGLRVPTLIIRGENSEELSQETYEEMLRANPLLRGVVIAGAGHWVHGDQPEHFIHALRDFFDYR